MKYKFEIDTDEIFEELETRNDREALQKLKQRKLSKVEFDIRTQDITCYWGLDDTALATNERGELLEPQES